MNPGADVHAGSRLLLGAGRTVKPEPFEEAILKKNLRSPSSPKGRAPDISKHRPDINSVSAITVSVFAEPLH
jgi:hypothetical protein